MILWGEVDIVDSELVWCHGGEKLPKEVGVNGTIDEVFFLTSLISTVPNLNAFSINRTGDGVNTTIVQCLHSNDILEQCSAGSRTKELSALQQLLKKYDQ